MTIKIKRVYEEAKPNDGTRILIDRLWPRGVSRENANIKKWMKEIAPTPDLIKWFGHDAKKWSEFKKRYKEQLKTNDKVKELKNVTKNGDLTLVYSAKDEKHNNAVVLKEVLEKINL